MKRISKATREEAIEACLCRADEWTIKALTDPDAIPSLAKDAFSVQIRELDGHVHESDTGAVWLEAAALLRDGWSPGDPVVLLRGAK